MEFPYPRTQFGIRFLAQSTFLAIILYLLAAPSVDSFWPVAFLATCFLAIVLVSVTPLFTHHEIADDGIRLRQGILFSIHIPFGDIEGVDEVHTKMWAFGLLPVGALGRIVLANGNRNLVSIKLKDRRRFPTLLWKSGREIIIDLVNPGGFVRLANEKLQR
jgi:hypothetical protein